MTHAADRPIRALHLFSNHKWTGPAEPSLNLCLALHEQGVNITFACAPGPAGTRNKITETARDRGIEPLLRFSLSKHRNPVLNFTDSRALYRFLRGAPFDLIHCHLDNDHQIALHAARKLSIPLIRSSYYGDGFPVQKRFRTLVDNCRFLIEPSGMALHADQKNFSLSPEKLAVVPGAVDVHRFDPALETPDGRRRLGIHPHVFTVGIVARMQTHRRYEDLFTAFKRLLEFLPDAQLIVIGRGTKQEQVGMTPVRALGIEDHVHFSGYLEGDTYTGMLRAVDAGVFLVPGSDGTCRAAREIMAMGKPLVVADRGMLPEIITHEKDGLVCDGSAEQLGIMLRRLGENLRLRHDMGTAARQTACTWYSLEAQSCQIHDIYRRILHF